jgi:hypothetical protein
LRIVDSQDRFHRVSLDLHLSSLTQVAGMLSGAWGNFPRADRLQSGPLLSRVAEFALVFTDPYGQGVKRTCGGTSPSRTVD